MDRQENEVQGGQEGQSILLINYGVKKDAPIHHIDCFEQDVCFANVSKKMSALLSHSDSSGLANDEDTWCAKDTNSH